MSLASRPPYLMVLVFAAMVLASMPVLLFEMRLRSEVHEALLREPPSPQPPPPRPPPPPPRVPPPPPRVPPPDPAPPALATNVFFSFAYPAAHFTPVNYHAFESYLRIYGNASSYRILVYAPDTARSYRFGESRSRP